jgi:hypothetical protein
MGTGVYENLCANVMFAAPLDGMRELLDALQKDCLSKVRRANEIANKIKEEREKQ